MSCPASQPLHSGLFQVNGRVTEQLQQRLQNHLHKIYDDNAALRAYDTIKDILLELGEPVAKNHGKWSERDTILITYGDSILQKGQAPLASLYDFLNKHLAEQVSAVHILPFLEYSSDDGFSVIDYYKVNDGLGTWSDIEKLREKFDLMFDLVINHISAKSRWFQGFLDDEHPYNEYFIVTDESSFDTSLVVRPRSSPLLAEFTVGSEVKKVWATFSHDQVDLNFDNVEVLIEFIKILVFYFQKGARFIRLDAVGFLFKESGTSCMHLPRTHQAIKLLRDVSEAVRADAVIITETNVPNRENLSYFGNRDEAHMIYNFSLPPLLLHSLLTGEVGSLKSWMMSMPPALPGCCYLNFTASHDGIGLRPLEGLVSTSEINGMVKALKSFGGLVSYRTGSDGKQSPYEVNIALYDACKGTVSGPDQWQRQRFLCSQVIMMGLEGIPAFYIHSLIATSNDHQAVKERGHNRAINRHKWKLEQLEQELADPSSERSVVFSRLKQLVDIRIKQRAFHPNATQFTLHLGKGIFAFWRQSPERDQSIFCVHNLGDRKRKFSLADLNLVITDSWFDLIGRQQFSDLHQQLVLQPYQCMWITNKF